MVKNQIITSLDIIACILILLPTEGMFLHLTYTTTDKAKLLHTRNGRSNPNLSLQPSMSRAELVFQQNCKNGDNGEAIIITNGVKHLITSPGFPDMYPRTAFQCKWTFKLSDVEENNDFVLRCDHFDVGRAQESGRCWGDALIIHGDTNSVLRNRKNTRKIDHLSLCGRRDGFQIRAVANQADEITINFKTGNNVQRSGFSCLVYTHAKAVNAEEEGSLIDAPSEEETRQCYCGKANHSPFINNKDVVNRIIGGSEANKNEYPWQAALVENGEHTPFCGGSLISPRHVLTAAHCTSDIKYPSDMNVLLGEHDVSTNFDRATRVRVARIHEHPGYNKDTLANDFSLLHLVEKIKMNHYIRPICLPDVTDLTRESFEGRTATVIGWGYQSLDRTHTNPLPSRLKHLKVELLGNKECSNRYKRPLESGWTTQIIPAMICAKNTNESSCFGDSGGPLAFVDSHEVHTIIGVVSFGPYACVDSVIPSVFARVNYVIEWIRSYVKNSDDVCPPAF